MFKNIFDFHAHTHKNWFKTQSFFHPSQSVLSKSDSLNNIQQAGTGVATFVSTHTKITSPCIHMCFLLMCALVCLCNLCLRAHEARVGLCECLNGFSRAPRYWCHVWEVFSLIYWPWQPLPPPLSPSPPLAVQHASRRAAPAAPKTHLCHSEAIATQQTHNMGDERNVSRRHTPGSCSTEAWLTCFQETIFLFSLKGEFTQNWYFPHLLLTTLWM